MVYKVYKPADPNRVTISEKMEHTFILFDLT